MRCGADKKCWWFNFMRETCLSCERKRAAQSVSCSNISCKPGLCFSDPACVSYSPSTVHSICASVAPELQPALGTRGGGPITAQATEAGSQLIGSCVSGTQSRCRSQHFPSLVPSFPRSLSFSLRPANHRCRRRSDVPSGHTHTHTELICTLHREF